MLHSAGRYWKSMHHMQIMWTQTNRIIVKQANVAFIPGIEKDRRSVTLPVAAEHQISLTKRVLHGEAEVINLERNNNN